MEKTIGAQFMEQSRVADIIGTEREQGAPLPPPQIPAEADARLIELPEPDLLADQNVNFLELVEVRTTARRYSAEPMTLKELSYLLWCTQGVKMVSPHGVTMRNVPSAGGRHAFETYLFMQNVEGLSAGLYRFLALEHALLPVDLTPEIAPVIKEAFYGCPMIEKCAALFIWTAVLQRMTYAYGQRAYRYLHLDAGHVCQNLYLAAHTVRCGVCAIGHYDDEKTNAALGLDGAEQFAIYAATTGKV